MSELIEEVIQEYIYKIYICIAAADLYSPVLTLNSGDAIPNWAVCVWFEFLYTYLSYILIGFKPEIRDLYYFSKSKQV